MKVFHYIFLTFAYYQTEYYQHITDEFSSAVSMDQQVVSTIGMSLLNITRTNRMVYVTPARSPNLPAATHPIQPHATISAVISPPPTTICRSEFAYCAQIK